MESIIEYINSQFSDMDFWSVIQTAGLVLSFLYLLLEFSQKSLLWIISACCSMIYASVYFHSKIYADMGFSLFNICMCVYGFYKWLHTPEHEKRTLSKSRRERSQIVYYRLSLRTWGFILLTGTTVWISIYTILRLFTDSPIPALDSLTTTLNITGTWILAQKYIEVWGVWFLVNSISIYIYCNRGLHISTILLYTVYLTASVYGFFKWKLRGTRMETGLVTSKKERGIHRFKETT